MGCCSGSDAGWSDLSEAHRRGVYDICYTTLLAPKPRKLILFAVNHFKKKHTAEEIHRKLRTEVRQLGLYANYPVELDANKSLSQLMDHAERQARMFTQKKFTDEFWKEKKLNIASDKDLIAFVQRAVKESMQHALLDRLKELMEESDAEDQDKTEQQQQQPKLSSSGSAINLKKDANSGKSATSSANSTNTAAAPAAAAAPASAGPSREPLAAASGGASSSSTASSQPQSKSSASTNATIAASSGSKSNAPASATTISSANSSSSGTTKKNTTTTTKKPTYATAPLPPMAGPAGPAPKDDNIWETCDDCDYWYAPHVGTMGCYYDPLKGLYFDFDTEIWGKTVPKKASTKKK